MKLAVSGKGGVGKTTVSALLAVELHRAGWKVTAIDADPNSNLLACMGYPHPESVKPLVGLKDLIEERTGRKAGTSGGMYVLNPCVDDIPDKYSVDVEGVKVLVAGTVKRGGRGCYCPENALVRSLVTHLLLEKDAALVLDMEAGIEHLGRGTVSAVDRLLVVVEPGMRSIETAERVRMLADDIGLKRVSVIANKIRSQDDETFLKKALKNFDAIGFLPYDEKIRKAELKGESVAAAGSSMNEAIRHIIGLLL